MRGIMTRETIFQGRMQVDLRGFQWYPGIVKAVAEAAAKGVVESGFGVSFLLIRHGFSGCPTLTGPSRNFILRRA